MSFVDIPIVVNVSICLACFNGERYIIEQVDSVVSQMEINDELIISDNGSSDATLDLLATLIDKRIKIIKCSKRGVVENFQNALSHAKCELIVLCDQDDVWLPGRLAAARQALQYSDISLVGLQYVNEKLTPLSNYACARSPSLSLMSTLFLNGYTGCCMAFRRDLMRFFLPFPPNVAMHDWWIALVALGVGAEITISDKQLILYRRHESNASATGFKSSASLLKKLSIRILIFSNLVKLLFRNSLFCKLKFRGAGFGRFLGEILNENVNRLRFAVLLAAYNGMSYIQEQIQSIICQRNSDIIIFISVDQSSDGTEAFLTKLALTEPRLMLLPFGQHFGGAGPNFYRLLRDVDLTGFDYVSFADQDDIWHPEKLWRAHCLMTEEGALGYSSNVTAFWPSGKTQLVNKAQTQRPLDFMFEAAGPGCTYVLQSSLALSLQKMVRAADSSLLLVGYHDWLIYAFARANNYAWVIDDWSSIQYRQHANNQIGVNAGWRSYWLRVRKMLSGHGFEQSLLIANLVNATSLPVVQQGLLGGRLGYLWLAVRANQCRRKRLDQVWFFILCVLFAIAKPARKGS